MTLDCYSVRIGESYCVAENVTYDALLTRIVEFTVQAAVARSIDEDEWEHEQLRRNGLAALQIFRNDKAVWDDVAAFEAELAEARRERIDARFEASNELNVELYRRIDADLKARWCRLGYSTPSLCHDMKALFVELERDASERAKDARASLLCELMRAQSEEPL
jgi:hypothetical protein